MTAKVRNYGLSRLSYNNDHIETRQLIPASVEQDTFSFTNRHAFWTTSSWRVQTSFWTRSDDSRLRNREATAIVAARIIIGLTSTKPSPCQIVFDFTPHLNPSTTMTFQATVPGYSRVSSLAKYGKIRDLVQLFEHNAATLTDRDQQGRSLLQVS